MSYHSADLATTHTINTCFLSLYQDQQMDIPDELRAYLRPQKPILKQPSDTLTSAKKASATYPAETQGPPTPQKPPGRTLKRQQTGLPGLRGQP